MASPEAFVLNAARQQDYPLTTVPPGPGDVLLVVDVQYDFLPGGKLAVAGGDEIIEPINAMASSAFAMCSSPRTGIRPAISPSLLDASGAKPFEVIELPLAPQVLWPDHCIIGTKARRVRALLDIPHVQTIVRKGFAETISIPTRHSRKTTTRR